MILAMNVWSSPTRTGLPAVDLHEFLRRELSPELDILRLLGRGSVAHVFLAHETALKRLVAVKVLRQHIVRDEIMLRRFEREAESIARIHHANVAAVHRIGRLSDGVPFMVLEYVEGRTAEDALAATGAFPPAEARRVLAETAEALAASHACGVVHRDIRPNNILIEHGTGRAVLSDFGIAALTDASFQGVDRLTATGELLGDVRYISPEQMRGEPVTGQSDVYSFGLFAWELLSGERPFDSVSLAQNAAQRLEGRHRPLREIRPDVDPEVASLVERCLVVEPNRRPTAAELAQRLRGGTGAATPQPKVGLAAFLQELRRRNVYQVGVSYLAAAFILLQAADLVLPALPAPGLTYNAMVVLTLAGFPIALVLSWIYDVSAGGIRRTGASGRGYGRSLLAWGGLVISAALFALLGWLLLLR